MRIIQVLIISLLLSIAFAQDDNVFINVTTGFKITKPSDWLFVTAEENLENIKRIQMKNEAFKQRMLKYSTAPLVAMMKYPEPFDDLNPSFKVNIKPLGHLRKL